LSGKGGGSSEDSVSLVLSDKQIIKKLKKLSFDNNNK
jgi:hypothetical protein